MVNRYLYNRVYAKDRDHYGKDDIRAGGTNRGALAFLWSKARDEVADGLGEHDSPENFKITGAAWQAKKRKNRHHASNIQYPVEHKRTGHSILFRGVGP